MSKRINYLLTLPKKQRKKNIERACCCIYLKGHMSIMQIFTFYNTLILYSINFFIMTLGVSNERIKKGDLYQYAYTFYAARTVALMIFSLVLSIKQYTKTVLNKLYTY